MIPEVEPLIISDEDHADVRRACAVMRARPHGVPELLADVTERVAVRESLHEFHVYEANGRVRLFLRHGDGWLSCYVFDWTETDGAMDRLVARSHHGA